MLIATRQIGDVLLCTPLLRSIRDAYLSAKIDVLVYADKGGMLEGNPHLDNVIEVEEHPNLAAYLKLVRRIFRGYDLVVSTQGGDRPFQYACIGAPRRVSIVPDLRWQDAWKRYVADAWTLLDDQHTHTVIQNLRLADLLNITRSYHVIPPSRADAIERLGSLLPFPWQDTPYVVLHPAPMWPYKRWTQGGWLDLAKYVLSRRIRVVLTGGPGQHERSLVSALAESLDTPYAVNVCGQLSFGQLSCLLRNGRCFVGPDTSVTHLAAACGIPTVAIFGPTNPVKWGPWPYQYAADRNPFVRCRPLQRQGNVVLVQGLGACVPCHNEGCEKHRQSYSRCLDELPSAAVVAPVATLLDTTPHSLSVQAR